MLIGKVLRPFHCVHLKCSYFWAGSIYFTSRLAIADVENKIDTRNQSKFSVQNPIRSNTRQFTNKPVSVYISGAMFIDTTYIVQNYVRVIIVWLWALILALGIGEGIRGLKRGVPFMVNSTSVYAVHSTVESQHSWVGAPQAFLK